MMDQKKIQELISRSQQEDAVAFSLLVSTFQPLVFRLAFRLLCDEDEAKDMVQETFVKVWLALGKYNGECRFSTWLYNWKTNAPSVSFPVLASIHYSYYLLYSSPLPSFHLFIFPFINT